VKCGDAPEIWHRCSIPMTSQLYTASRMGVAVEASADPSLYLTLLGISASAGYPMSLGYPDEIVPSQNPPANGFQA
jgi:hypothetical protein